MIKKINPLPPICYEHSFAGALLSISYRVVRKLPPIIVSTLLGFVADINNASANCCNAAEIYTYVCKIFPQHVCFYFHYNFHVHGVKTSEH